MRGRRVRVKTRVHWNGQKGCNSHATSRFFFFDRPPHFPSALFSFLRLPSFLSFFTSLLFFPLRFLITNEHGSTLHHPIPDSQWHTLTAFFLFGLTNNFPFVVMLSAALDILQRDDPSLGEMGDERDEGKREKRKERTKRGKEQEGGEEGEGEGDKKWWNLSSSFSRSFPNAVS